MIFDTHSHYNDKQYTQDREAVLASLKDAGVTQVVNVSESWKDLLRSEEIRVVKYCKVRCRYRW